MTVEMDDYGGRKCISNVFRNDDEATDIMGYISEGARAENVASKTIFDDVSFYGRTAKKLLTHFRTVLDVLKLLNSVL